MELWLWVVSGVIWLVAAVSIGIGIYKLLVGLKLIRFVSAQLKQYSISERIINADRLKKAAKDMGQKVQEYKQFLSEWKTKLPAKNLKRELSGIEREMKKVDRGAIEINKIIEEYESETVEIQRQLENSVIPASETGAQITKTLATSDIALSAALFALASVLIGISAVLIAIFTSV